MAHTAMPCQRRTGRPTLRVENRHLGKKLQCKYIYFIIYYIIYYIDDIWMFLDGVSFAKSSGKNVLFVG